MPDGVELIEAFDVRLTDRLVPGELRRRARILNRHLSDRPPWDLVVSTLLVADRISARSTVAHQVWHVVVTVPSKAYIGTRTGLKRHRRLRRLRDAYTDRRVISVSEGAGRDLVETLDLRPRQCVAIPNPFDISRIRRLASEPSELEGADYLVHLGRFGPAKRLDRLLGAFGRSRFPGKLVIVGTGLQSQRERVKKLIATSGLEDRVQLTGFRLNPYPIVKHARALVVSSDYEGFCNVIVEALICGTPVASTRCPSGPEEILTGDLSIGLSDLTEEDLAEAIDRVLENPPPISEADVERYAVDAITKRYLALAD